MTDTTTKTKVRHAVTVNGNSIEYKGTRYALADTAQEAFIGYALAKVAKAALSAEGVAKDADEAVNALLASVIASLNDGSFYQRDTSGTADRFRNVLAKITNRTNEDTDIVIASKRSTLGPENFDKWQAQVRHLAEFKTAFSTMYPRKPKTGGGRKKTITLDSLLA